MRSDQTQTPAINRDVEDIADRAKYAYAKGTQLLAATQYRLAELAGTGRLDAEEVWELHDQLLRIWEELYFGTFTPCAPRHRR
ncbi:hypothetical protein [Mycolicibacterium tusciae]|uniref:Uncharacterized protein n=1 Tax=Mycolicibacterium tusciae TaxID=75922 RepID=A0A1X0K162_9MYCO|nr:hypothetical protein [Mycolicibacterium tusciae]ORB68802.1 hypothetical protein BST47_02645 [Mycolicibacterium tusciae]